MSGTVSQTNSVIVETFSNDSKGSTHCERKKKRQKYTLEENVRPTEDEFMIFTISKI